MYKFYFFLCNLTCIVNPNVEVIMAIQSVLTGHSLAQTGKTVLNLHLYVG